jgi:hypothetical protein
LTRPHKYIVPILLILCLSFLLLGARKDPLEESKKLWSWTQPEAYPQPIPGDLDIETLSIMLDSGNLQWYMPRPEEGNWDSIVGMKVHAPRELVWEVLTDYEDYPNIMPDTLLVYYFGSRDDNKINHSWDAKTSVINFEFNYKIVDQLTEEPPRHLHVDTVDGGLKGGKIDYYLVPVDKGKNTLIFIRYFPHIKSLGVSIRTVLAVIPTMEWPVSASAANYIVRSIRNKAERLAGYTPPPEPGPLKYHALDVETLRMLDRYSTGLIRETPEGKTINGMNYRFIEAPPSLVWDVLMDFDNYQEFKQGEFEVIKREESQLLLRQKAATFSILIFSFGGMEMNNLYTWEPPDHLSFRTVDGLYEGSMGDYQIVSVDGGKGTLLFNTIGLNFEKDTSLTTRMMQSGAFPFNTMMCVTMASGNLTEITEEAERRAGSER